MVYTPGYSMNTCAYCLQGAIYRAKPEIYWYALQSYTPSNITMPPTTVAPVNTSNSCTVTVTPLERL
jgi:hypothetical protein